MENSERTTESIHQKSEISLQRQSKSNCKTDRNKIGTNPTNTLTKGRRRSREKRNGIKTSGWRGQQRPYLRHCWCHQKEDISVRSIFCVRRWEMKVRGRHHEELKSDDS